MTLPTEPDLTACRQASVEGSSNSASKVVVVTHGRFHYLDLAAELQAAGRLGAIYTGYPQFKLRNTAVDPRLIRSFPWLHTLQIGFIRLPYCPKWLIDETGWRAAQTLRRHAARTLPECGVVVAASGAGLEAGRTIQRRGGVYLCDRGSTHIRWVERELAAEYDRLGWRWSGIDPRAVANEEAEYALADAITVPSRFSLRTYVEMGVPSDRLHLVPYGVNLDAFRRCAEPAANFRVLFVGGLSVRKGLHYLLEAFRLADLPGSELVLVGGRTPETAALLDRCRIDRLTWTGSLPRAEVAREMSRASVMVLASIEEGLALVQAQAMACGCPVIATTHTGAEDLFEDGREGFIVAPRDPEALAERLTRLYRDPELQAAMSAAAVARVTALGGWNCYGRAMMDLFDKLVGQRGARLPEEAVPGHR